jgi:IclR family transcriptional regulator, KDG regulon repressor
MASTPRSKPTRSGTAKAHPGTAKARPTGRAMRGLVKVVRPKAAAGRTVSSKAARTATTRTKRTASKAAVRKTTSARKAATAKPAARKPVRGGMTSARKIAAKKSVAKRPRVTTAAGRSVTAPKKAAPKRTASKKPAATHVATRPVARKQPIAKTAAPKKDPPRMPAAVKALPAPVAHPPARKPEVKPAIDLVAREKEMAREHASTAVNRALSLLETMARTGPVPLAVLADAAGCGKTAAFELLTTMQGRNFVIQDDTHGLWRLGARWAVLGSAASEQGALAATAMPYLAALGNATGENVYLRVREGMECETVAIYQTDPGLRVYTEVGKKMPLHAGSGRLLLAHAPEAVQTQVLAQRLQRYTPSTRIDPSWIAADLHRIRQRGFLITDSEVVAGTVSVCAAVRDASGQVVAAMLIGAPSLRMRPPRPRALMPAVVEAARKLSHALGSISEQPAAGQTNGPMEPRQVGAFSGAWPSTALGATISRPHSIFR